MKLLKLTEIGFINVNLISSEKYTLLYNQERKKAGLGIIPRFLFLDQKSTPNERLTDQNKLTFLAECYILRDLLMI